MAMPEAHAEEEPPFRYPLPQGSSQSVNLPRRPLSNSSTRRAHFNSTPTELPRSGTSSSEDMLRSLHQRSIRRPGSRSRQDADPDVVFYPSAPPPEDGQGEHSARGSLVVEAAYDTSAQVDEENRGMPDDEKSISSIRSEQTYLQRRDLGMLDVAALIINKQIGTGIFTTPGLVLSLTGSKTTSIVMWFCGGIWAFLSVIIYVEFGTAFPFNGGELIYLDEVFRSPELLAAVLFSAFFITVPNTDGNSLQFAKHILLTALPDVIDTTQLDKRLISFVAITVLTVVCAIHYFSRNSGLLLNLVFAMYKIVLVIIFIICGCIASRQPENGKSDWGEQPVKSKNALAAMIYIIYSYQGWENANYVGGELKVKSRALKRGAFLAVGIVTLLYTLVTMAYSLTCKFDELAGHDLGVVIKFAPKAFGSSGSQGIKICIALSAFGNLIAVVYTSARVKQQIARQCIIPFYKFFGREAPHFKTPDGAIILHWVFAVIWILATPNTSDGYGFVIGLFIYGQLVVGVFVGCAFFWIRRNYEADTTRSTAWTTGPVVWTPVILKNLYLRVVCALIFIGMNMMVIVQSARSSGYPPSWLRPVVIAGLLFVAFLYWASLSLVAKKSDENSSLEIRIVRDGIPVANPADLPVLDKARLEGNSRVVIYETHGKLKSMLSSIEGTLHQIAKLAIR